MRYRVVLAVLGLLYASSVVHARGMDVAYAIVIGNNAPPHDTPEKLAPLRYADDDAVRYYQLFSRMADTRLLAVLDTQTQRRYPGLAARTEPPTLANVNRVVAELAARMETDRRDGNRPVLYFVFSGHGARDHRGESFLALVDGALTQQTLYDGVLARMPTAVTHLIVDACNAGGVVGVRGDFFAAEASARSAPVTTDDVRPILEATPLSRYPHIGVILATTLGQQAHEWSAIESGVFTHELLSGLLGAADVNGDLVVEYTEVQAFVAAANRNIKDPRAIPHVIAKPPQVNQNVALVALSALRGTRLVRGNASALGHFHIELDNGQRYLDAHVEPGAAIAIAVPDATTAFLRTATREARLPARGPIELSSLAMVARTVASRGSIEAAYQDALFSAHYGRAYYQGFVDSIGAVGVRFAPADGAIDHPRTGSSKRAAALGTTVVAGVLGATAIGSGVVALQAKRAFDNTTLQRPADEARRRYEKYGTISVATGVGALAAGAVSWWLWRGSRAQVVPAVSGRSDVGVLVQLAW